MVVLRFTQEIDRPVEDVFSVVIDGGKFADWNPTITASRQLTPDPIGEGTRFEWSSAGSGASSRSSRSSNPTRRVRIVPHHRALEGGHSFTFTDLGGRTRIDHELVMTPKGVFKVFSPLMSSMGTKNLNATASALNAFLTEGGA